MLDTYHLSEFNCVKRYNTIHVKTMQLQIIMYFVESGGLIIIQDITNSDQLNYTLTK